MAETDQNQPLETTPASDAGNTDKLATLGGDLLTQPQALPTIQRDTPADATSLVIPSEITVADARTRRGTTDAALTPEDKYKAARKTYEEQLGKYWGDLLVTRKAKNFTTEFPPRYEGPPKPKGTVEPKVEKTLPRLNDMLDGSRNLTRLLTGDTNQPDFAISPVSENQFKQNYAREILNTATKNGITPEAARNIVQRIYAFESGGAGTHDMLSGMPQDLLKEDKPGETTIADQRRAFRPNSTAIGYTQMLQYNTVKNFELNSPEISGRLRELAQADPLRAKELTDKADMVDRLQTLVKNEMLSFAKANAEGPADKRKPYLDKDGNITELLRQDFAKSDIKLPGREITGRQFSSSLHALHMDGDIGPVLQSLEFNHLLKFAKDNDYTGLLAKENLEFNKRVSQFDALSSPDKTKALAEIMSRVTPPANASAADVKKFNETKEGLIKKIAALGPGANPELAREKMSDAENEMLNGKILQLKKFTDAGGPLSNNARLMMDKLFVARFGELTADKLMPAALELANLAGSGNALLMLKNMDKPTTNFFDRAGYEANPTSNGRTAEELLLQIHRNMHGPNGDPLKRPGVDALIKAFDAIK